MHIDNVVMGYGTLTTETVFFSETLVSTYESTQHNNPEEPQHHLHQHQNLKSHMYVHCLNKQRKNQLCPDWGYINNLNTEVKENYDACHYYSVRK
jgi:hypothetical protein